jgi:hypothetical protein
MAAFVSTVQALVAHRDELFLKRIAEEYKLDLAELCAKFLEAPAPKEKKKRAIKVKLTADGKEIRCQGFTAKKEQCSFGPLPGQCFCKRHLPASAAPEEAPEVHTTPSALLSPIPEAPEAPEAPEEVEPFTVAEEDQVGFDRLTPLTPAKSVDAPASLEGTPCNLWAKLEEVQAEADQEELERELERMRRSEQEQEALLEALRKQEAEPEPAPYEPPADSPSPVKKAPKRRQSTRPKVAKK